MKVDMGVTRIQKVQRLAGNQLQLTAGCLRIVAAGGKRVKTPLSQRFRPQLCLARPRRKSSMCERSPVAFVIQPRVAVLIEPFIGDAFQPRVAAVQSSPQQSFIAVEQPGLRAPQRGGQAAEEFSV